MRAYETLKDPIKRREYDRSLALIKYKPPETSLKDFEYKSKQETETSKMDRWIFGQNGSRKESNSGRKENETDNLQERIEDIRVFRNRVIVIGAILIGYWISTFRSK